jgi:hypothetical protein
LVRLIPVIFFSLALAACTRNAATPEPNDTNVVPAPTPQSSTQESDWRAIEKLEAEARAMAKVDGCTSSGDCATGPIGRKACGSPRDYVIYCAKSTDTDALKAKLDAIVKAETAYNQKYNMVSTCEMRLPPEVEASGGSCRTK